MTYGMTRDAAKSLVAFVSGAAIIGGYESTDGGNWNEWAITAGASKYVFCDLHYTV